MGSLCLDNHISIFEHDGNDNNDFNATQQTTESNVGIPRVSQCMQETVLYLLPAIFLLLFTPLVVYSFRKSRNGPLLRQNPITIKLLTSSFLLLNVLIQIGYFVAKWLLVDDDDPSGQLRSADAAKPTAKLLSLLLLGASQLLALFLLFGCKKFGLVTSGILFNYWLLLAICGAPQFRATVEVFTGNVEHQYFEATLFALYYLAVLFALLLSCFADKPQFTVYSEKACPEWSVSFFNKIIFWWFNKMAKLGNERDLRMDDLWELLERDKSNHLVEKFGKIRAKQFEAIEQQNKKKSKVKVSKKDGLEETELLQPNSAADKAKTGDSKSHATHQSNPPSLIWALFLTFQWPIFSAFFYKIVYDLLQFVPPRLLDAIIAFMENPAENVWIGVGIALVMFVVNIVQSMFLHQFFYTMFRLGMNVRSILSSEVYRKSLLLSNGARKNRTIGEIVNLMSVDIQRFQDFTSSINFFWSAPLQVVLALFFLWRLLGIAIVAGLVCLLAFIPFNAKISLIMRSYQQKQMTLKDERLKLLNEMLNGIKVLKLYAWEESIQSRILGIRKKELQTLKHMAYLNTVSIISWACAPFLVAVITFLAYVALDPANNILNPRTTFVALSLFNILRFPLAIFPMLSTQAIQCSVSNKRLKTFLAEEEIQTVSDRISDPDLAIAIRDASFGWDLDGPPLLRNINLSIKKGSLVAIVGRIGSGKSSLLSSILGEMYRQSGTVGIDSRVAYVPQQAWIQNLTVRKNILFNNPWDQRRYEKCLNACALEQDLAQLPAGDETEIGEKGINLSGGQKQRISLARAAYSDCDIYFLDDPLSAVDSHVGKHIFENLIASTSGMLEGKTRVLVTHGLTFLKYCDQIIVLKDGQISESGSYKELLKDSGEFSEIIEEYLQKDVADEGKKDDSELQEILTELEHIDPEKRAKIIRQASSQSTQSSKTGSEVGQKPPSSPPISTIKEAEEEQQPLLVMEEKTAVMEEAKVVGQNGDLPPAPPTSTTQTQMASSAPKSAKIIEKEEVFTGKVKFKVYLDYLRAVTFHICTIFILIYIASSVVGVLCNLWLARFSDQAEQIQRGDGSLSHETLFNLGVYASLGIGQALGIALGSIIMSFGMIHAGRVLHEKMLKHVLHARMAWFDITPLGRIVNRFGKDIDCLDSRIPGCFANFISYLLQSLVILSIPVVIIPWVGPVYAGILIFHIFTLDVDSLDSDIPRSMAQFLRTMLMSVETICMICYATPPFSAVILPLAIFYGFVLRYYVSTSRQLKRLELTTKSPIYSHFQESVQGASSIRAYHCVDRFLDESQRRVDTNISTYYPSIISNRWLAVRLELVGNLIVFFSALSAVLFRSSEHVTAGLAGLSISYAMQVTQTLNWAVRMTSELETNIVSVERIKDYCESPETEPSLETPKELNLSEKWPEKGEIRFENLAMRYRPHLDLVLKGVTAHLQPREKIGIIGRTGAGKSSLTLALFRICEPSSGRIIIDDVDIARLGIRDLRSRLTIVPQDPVLFSGTLRVNLDPFDQYSDSDIWTALELTHLRDFVETLPDKLEHKISEGGQNLSVGQRQLICLTRALLRQSRILILDEAAASVDIETDHLIQSTIRDQFRDCTVLTIAHRLHSVLESDRLLVFSEGRVTEFDSPQNLFAQPNSLFRLLALDAGINSLQPAAAAGNSNNGKEKTN